MRVILLSVVVLLLAACSSSPVIVTEPFMSCEGNGVSRGDFIMDLRTAEVGVVEIPCHLNGDTRMVKVILERRDGTALIRRSVPRQYVAAITMISEEG